MYLGSTTAFTCMHNSFYVLSGTLVQVYKNTSPYCEGDVRLVNGTNVAEGRVEVWYSERWTTVCDDYWSPIDANLVCQQLGYRSAVKAHRGAHFGKGLGDILLDNLQCTGREASLLDCPHNGLYVHNCNHQEDAGVTCECILCTFVHHEMFCSIMIW